jgi:DNA-binding transcriptional ArsR family regulator
MIEFVLAPTDLARVRFAHSPIRELVVSLRVLHDRSRQHMYSEWLSAVRGQLGGLRLELLTALMPTGRYLPSFMMPPATRQWEVLADELDAVAATPADVVRAELEKLCEGRPMPVVLRPLYENPAAHLPTIVEELRRYWQVAVEPVWQRLRVLIMADLSYRMEQFASGGVAHMLGELHSEISLKDDRLHIDKPHHCQNRLDLTGAGVLLLPCVFSWPTLIVECCDTGQPSLTYPPRGIAQFWEESGTEQVDPLSALLGRTRAVLLATLSLPRTTTQLAEQLDLSPAAVSQHLKILKDTALVSARRRGRIVLYQRTAAATALLTAIGVDQATG